MQKSKLKFIGSWTLKAKLIGITILGLSALVFLGWKSYSQMQQLSANYEPIGKDSLPASRFLGDILYKFRQLRIEVRSIPLSHNSDAQIENYISESKKAVEAVEASLKDLKLYIDTPEEQAAFDRLQKSWIDFKNFGGHVFGVASKRSPGSMVEVAHLIRDVCPEKTKPFEDNIKTLIQNQSSMAEFRMKTARVGSQAAVKAVVATCLISTLVLLAISLTISTHLANQLNSVTQSVDASSGAVSSSVNQVSQSSQNVMTATQQQAAAIQETSAALEEISAMVSRSAEKSSQVLDSSEQSKSYAEQGQENVARLISAMENLKNANQLSAQELQESNEKVGQILKVIEEVATKTRVINDIVFQTKLLSFNASVEAARAGEHGKGFSVVAEEVGNLARMSGEAAKEINNLLDSSLFQVRETLDNNRDCVTKMVETTMKLLDEGAQVSSQCQDSLHLILEGSRSVATLVSEIATSSKESARGVQEITKAIHEIDQASSQTAQAAETCRASSEDLSREVLRLQVVSDQLNQTVHGQTGTQRKTHELGTLQPQSFMNEVSVNENLRPAQPDSNRQAA